ncbi:MAG: leucyl aminopeptidase, partial [Candidatus Marinamargulisbacteria bacterium]
MKFYATSSPDLNETADALTVGFFNDKNLSTSATNKALPADISKIVKDLVKSKEFLGRSGDMTIIHHFGQWSAPFAKIIFVGLGKKEDFTYDTYRHIAGTLIRKSRDLNISKLGWFLSPEHIDGKDTEKLAQALAEGCMMGAYRFRRYKTDKTGSETPNVKGIAILTQSPDIQKSIQKSLDKGAILGESVI